MTARRPAPDLSEQEAAVVARFEAAPVIEEAWEQRAHGPEEDCPACFECPGCGGGSGATPVDWRLDRETYPGAVLLICNDCDGTGFTCPNIDPRITS